MNGEPMTSDSHPSSNQCAICGQPATCVTLKDPWGKSGEMEGRCAKHSPKLRDPDDVALIDRQRAEIERLESDLAAEKALRAEAESFAEDRERHTALVVRGGAEIIAERDRLRAALLNHVCNCGPTDPDPSVHREDCAYRLALSGEHASAHETKCDCTHLEWVVNQLSIAETLEDFEAAREHARRAQNGEGD